MFAMSDSTIVTLDPIKLDFRGLMWDCRPRMLWQKLFDFYRRSKCDLKRLDNLLLDYENCKKLFDEEFIYPQKKAVHFIFGCESSHFMTTWIPQRSWLYDSPKHTVLFSNYDNNLVCSINSERAKLIPVIKKE